MAVPSPLTAPDKTALRRAAREARRAYVAGLGEGERERLEAALGEALKPLLAEARTIGAYAAMADEIDPLPAIAAGAPQAPVAFPYFAGPDERFVFRIGDPCEAGPFGIRQPSAACPEAEPDLILVPLVAIDGEGHRLGQGKGHYDRVLPDARRRGARLIGVGWAMQALDQRLPAESWDVRLDGFASPAGLRNFR